MPPDVRDRLLGDPQGRGLDRSGEHESPLGRIDLHHRQAPGCGHALADRGGEAPVVEHRRAEVVGDLAQLSRRGVEPGDQALRGIRSPVVSHAGERLDRRRRETEPGEGGGELVVEIAAQALAFLLAREHDAGAGLLQLGNDACAVQGGRRLGADLGEHDAIGRCELRLAGTRGDDELAEFLSGVGDREPGRLRVADLAGLRGHTVRALHTGVPHAEGARDPLDDLRGDAPRIDGGGEPVAQGDQGAQRIGVPPRHDQVGHTACADRERHGDDRGRHTREPCSTARRPGIRAQ